MELRFDPMLCSNLGNENYVAGHIKRSSGPQVPHPWFKPLKVASRHESSDPLQWRYVDSK